MFGAMRGGNSAGAAQHQARARHPALCDRGLGLHWRGRRAGGEPACRRHRRTPSGSTCCLLLDGAAAGWLRYEDVLAESRADFGPPSPWRRSSRLPALYLGLHRQAQRRCADARRTILVDRLPAQILADARGEPRSCRRAAVPQECDGGRDQADAERRRLCRAAAKLRAAAFSEGARRAIAAPMRAACRRCSRCSFRNATLSRASTSPR